MFWCLHSFVFEAARGWRRGAIYLKFMYILILFYVLFGEYD